MANRNFRILAAAVLAISGAGCGDVHTVYLINCPEGHALVTRDIAGEGGTQAPGAAGAAAASIRAECKPLEPAPEADQTDDVRPGYW